MANIHSYDNKFSDILTSFISVSTHSLSYKTNIDKAISNELWEYSVIAVWRLVILFFYEKMYHNYVLRQLNQDFINMLNTYNRDCYSCFSFNCMEDIKIYEKMSFIWRNLDANYKNIYRRLLEERNSLSHVNEYPYSEIKFKAYAEDVLNLLNYLQELHIKLNLEPIYNHIKASGDFKYLSESELDKLMTKWPQDTDMLIFLVSLIPSGQINDMRISTIKETAINLFTSAGSYVGAKIKGKRLVKPIVPYFEEIDFYNVIDTLIRTDNRQVLFASDIEDVFITLYNESTNNYPKTDTLWNRFIDFVDKIGATVYFEQLKPLVKST